MGGTEISSSSRRQRPISFDAHVALLAAVLAVAEVVLAAEEGITKVIQ